MLCEHGLVDFVKSEVIGVFVGGSGGYVVGQRSRDAIAERRGRRR